MATTNSAHAVDSGYPRPKAATQPSHASTDAQESQQESSIARDPAVVARVTDAEPTNGRGAHLSDATCDRLLSSLEQMEADYARTVAADSRRLHEAEGTALRAQLLQQAAEPELSGCRDEDDAASSGPNEGSMTGYARLGSEDGDGNLDSDVEEAEKGAPEAKEEAATAVDQEKCSSADAWGNGSWSSPAGLAEESESLENFADFGEGNPALPTAPPNIPQLQATPLTDQEVKLIKQTMLQVDLQPPPWASRIPDAELDRMIKELTRSAP